MIFKFPYFAHNPRKDDVTTLHEQSVPSGCVPKLTYSTRKPAYSKSNIYPLVMSGSSICTMQTIPVKFVQRNKSTSVTITPLFLSHLNAGPKTKKLKGNTIGIISRRVCLQESTEKLGIITRRVCLQESTEKQTEGQHKAMTAPNMY